MSIANADSFNSFSDYVSAMSIEMKHLQEQGFLVATTVVIVIQETRIQRLSLRSEDSWVRQAAIKGLSRCRTTIKRLKRLQAKLGCTTKFLEGVLLEIDKELANGTPQMPNLPEDWRQGFAESMTDHASNRSEQSPSSVLGLESLPDFEQMSVGWAGDVGIQVCSPLW